MIKERDLQWQGKVDNANNLIASQKEVIDDSDRLIKELESQVKTDSLLLLKKSEQIEILKDRDEANQKMIKLVKPKIWEHRYLWFAVKVRKTIMKPGVLKEVIKKEYKKCAEDPIYFLKKYCVVQHPMKGKVPFHLYDIKKISEHLKTIDLTLYSNSSVRIINIDCGYSLWMMTFGQIRTY